jgi:hypothetical protein
MSHNRHAAPTRYEIRVAGSLAPERANWFGGLALTAERTESGAAVTVLSGPVIDGAALFGILNRIRDLGLVLISVNPIAPEGRDAASGDLERKEIQ